MPFTVAVRHPGTSGKFDVKLNGENVSEEEEDGYLCLTRAWQEGDLITVDLDAEFRFIYANPLVDSDAGKTALTKGPLVYCLEEKDNGKHLAGVYADTDAEVSECSVEGLPEGVPCAVLQGLRIMPGEDRPLYSYTKPERRKAELIAVPYCLWNNRGKGEMTVWMKTV